MVSSSSYLTRFKLQRLVRRLDSLHMTNQHRFAPAAAGRPIAAVYYDTDPEALKARQLGGVCVRVRRRHLNSKVVLRSSNRGISFTLNLFAYSPHALDFKFYRRRG